MSDRIQIKEIATGTIINVLPIDAKESLATGRYERVGEVTAAGAADTPTAPATLKENPASAINNMNTAELAALVAEKGLVIEGLEGMNLKEKRQAVAAAIAA